MELRRLENIEELTPEIFSVFRRQPPLLTAGNRENCNTMTIGWCQLGSLWSIPVCTVFVQPERYTYQFMEESRYFTVSVLPEEAKAVTAYCGTKSGRDTDKIRDCGLTLRYGAGDAPFFAESEWALVCEKLYAQDLSPEHMVVPAPIEKYYDAAHGGWHRSYIGRVVEVYHR